MPVYHQPAKPAVDAAVLAGSPVSDRLEELATEAGYVIGPGGIQVFATGAVDIDADRDPSADWADFDPTVLTAQETADTALRAEVIAALADLDTGAELLLGTGAVSEATYRLIVGRLCQIQAGAIRVLVTPSGYPRGIVDGQEA